MSRMNKFLVALAVLALPYPALGEDTLEVHEGEPVSNVQVSLVEQKPLPEATTTAPLPVELLSRIDRLEQLVADQARVIERLTADSPPAPAAAVAPAVPAAAAMQLPAEDLRQADYLPSRSWAGGRLHYGGDEVKIEMHGFMDLEYTDAEADGSRDGVSTFDNHHANLFVTSRVSRNLLGHVEIEYEHSGDSVEIDQAFMSFKAAEWMTIDAGRFYTPFGIERFVWYSPTNQLISRPLSHRQIVPGNFYAQGLKVGGLVRHGGQPRFSYEVSLTDGLGEDALTSRRGSRQTRDNNSSRALSGRGSVILSPRVEIGSSYHWQRYSTDDRLNMSFFGLDFAARWQGFELRAERVAARFDQPGASSPDMRQNGWYSQLSYTFNSPRVLFPTVTLVGRFDQADFDESVIDNGDRRRLSVGTNVSVVEHLRVKLEYQLAEEDGAPKRDNAFLGQVVLDF